MDLMGKAQELLTAQLAEKVSGDNVKSSLGALCDESGGDLDIGSIISKMTSGDGLQNLVGSW